MPRATRTLTGAARDKYFRDLFAAEPELPRAAAERLQRALAREIAQLRVREPVPLRGAAPAATQPAPADIATPEQRPVETPQPAATKDAAPAASPPAFDPYAFSLVACFRKSGRDALLARLDAIDSPANLRRLAEAQHIALPAAIEGLAELRDAIVDGTERRIADRRAAAS